MAEFYQNLIRIRKERKISQEKLSEMTGIAQSAISMIEANLRSPTEQTMQMLADGLGVPLSELIRPAAPIAPQKTETYDTLLLPDERQLLSDYRTLTRQGRAYILQQMEIAKKIYGQLDAVPNVETEMIGGQ